MSTLEARLENSLLGSHTKANLSYRPYQSHTEAMGYEAKQVHNQPHQIKALKCSSIRPASLSIWGDLGVLLLSRLLELSIAAQKAY